MTIALNLSSVKDVDVPVAAAPIPPKPDASDDDVLLRIPVTLVVFLCLSVFGALLVCAAGWYIATYAVTSGGLTDITTICTIYVILIFVSFACVPFSTLLLVVRSGCRVETVRDRKAPVIVTIPTSNVV